MKVSDRFEIERDKYNWLLHETTKGKTKKGMPRDVRRTTYHANLEQTLAEIIDRECGLCESLEGVMEYLSKLKTILPNVHWKD